MKGFEGQLLISDIGASKWKQTTNEHVSVPITLHLQKEAMSQSWPMDCS